MSTTNITGVIKTSSSVSGNIISSSSGSLNSYKASGAMADFLRIYPSLNLAIVNANGIKFSNGSTKITSYIPLSTVTISGYIQYGTSGSIYYPAKLTISSSGTYTVTYVYEFGGVYQSLSSSITCYGYFSGCYIYS